MVDQLVDALAVRRGHGDDVAEAVAGEIVAGGLGIEAVDLVDHQHGRPRGLAQPGQDLVVQRRGAFAAVDDEQHQVGFLGRGACLARGRAGQALVLAGDAAGVDDGERLLALGAAHAVMAIAGHARLVMDQGVATARQRIEERRFSDVGATNEGN